MKHTTILGESLLSEVTNGQATGPDATYQVVDRKTGHAVSKPTSDKEAAGRMASKLSGERGDSRYVIRQIRNLEDDAPQSMYQIIDIQTGDPVGKPSPNRRRLSNRANKLDLQYGAVRYAVRRLGVIDELDRSDLELVRQVDKEKQDKRDRTRTRDEFRDKMRSREGQGLQSGDRVYSKKADKMYAVKRVTPDGVLFKGADRPIKINTKNSGRKTNLGHRVFIVDSQY